MGDDAFDNLERETIENERMRDAAGDTTSGDVPRDPGASAPPPSDPHDADSGDRAPNAPREPFYHLTEGGNAARFVDLFAGKLLYVEGWGWCSHDGTRYKRAADSEASEAAKAVIAQLYESCSAASGRLETLKATHADVLEVGRLDARKADNKAKRDAARSTKEWKECEAAEAISAALMQWAARSDSAHGIKSMLKMASTDPRIARKPEDFDRNGWLFNCLNGTINLKTGKLQPHRREDLITNLAPFEYNPDAECPRWNTFLKQMIPSDSVRGWWKRFLGYCMTGDVSEQCWAFALGDGSNGKNVIADLFMRMFGDYARVAPPDLLTLKNNEPHPTQIACLSGKRLIVASEIDANKTWDEAALKRFTGDGRLSGRFIGGDFFDFDVQFKVIVLANGKLKVRDTSNGFWRRVMLSLFGVVIADKEQDKQLIPTLLKEAPGIIAWAVKGCLEWQEMKGLHPPQEMLDLKAKYRVEQDVVSLWLSERCVCVCESVQRVEIGTDDDGLAFDTCTACGAEIVSKSVWDKMPDNKFQAIESKRRKHEFRQDLLADFNAFCVSRGEKTWVWNQLRTELMKPVQGRGRAEYRNKYGRGLTGIRLRYDNPIFTPMSARTSRSAG